MIWLLLTARAHGLNVQVSGTPNLVENEVSLTLNPASAGNVVVAYNDNPVAGSTLGLGVSFSTDFGQTWTDRQIGTPAPLDPFSGTTLDQIFDPISGADTQGNILAGYIATDGAAGGPSGLYVHRSTDGGNNWTAPIAVRNDPPSALVPPPGPYRFNDKPHLTFDRFAASPRKDTAYVSWIQDDGVNPPSNILFSTSLDAGNTWSPAVIVNDNLLGPNTDLGNGPNVAAAPNGDVFVAWLDVDVTNAAPKPGTLMIDKSLDGGTTFGPDVNIRTIRALPNNLTTAAGGTDARARSFPAIAVNPNNAQDVYLVYAEDPDFIAPGNDGPDEADVFFLKSSDGGVNWSAPLRVNDDLTTTDQFEPWIAVKPDGTIDVVWYDKRNDPVNDVLWDVYFANSTDGGNTFAPNIRVSDVSFAAPNTAGGPWLGEYLGLAVDGTSAFVGFTSSTTDANGGDIFFERVNNFAEVFFIPEPPALPMMLIGILGLVFLARRQPDRASGRFCSAKFTRTVG